jgi:glycosyltransferase involved in cell wall biosynthesis
MLSITYYYREPRKTGVSIEGIFRLVKECLKKDANIKEFFCDAGKSRLQNTREAGKHTSDINHITGDVNFLALGLKGKKNILTIHDMGHCDTLKERNFIHYIIYKLFWYQFPLKRVQIVTVISEFTKGKLLEYFDVPEHKIRIIHDPVKPLFKFAKKERINDIPVVLMMGTGKHKNLATLIEAVNGTRYHLDIIGWPSKEELEKLDGYKISYKIFNRLSDEEVYERYQKCDILYNASFNEGFGMPIVEAQSVGRTVITSNFGAMKEVAGDAAVLVDPHKPEEIRNAIEKLANDKAFYDELVTRGIENIKKYQYQFIAQQYLDVYKELA